MEQRILVVGSANADYVMTASRMPEAGETLRGESFRVQAGGKGLNQAVAAAKLGGQVTFLGAIGADADGAMLREELRRHNVGFAEVCADVPTGVAMIVVADGDNRILLHEGANACLTPSVIEQYSTVLAASEYVILQLEIPMETVRRVCELAERYGVKVVLNPAPFRPLEETLCRQIDLLVPNEHEAQALTGITITDRASAEEAARRLLARGVRRVVITLGGEGCVYTDGERVVHHPACPVTVVDTTSAGDSFIGAMVTRLAAGEPIGDAIAFATRVAAITVSREGAASSIPTAAELTG